MEVNHCKCYHLKPAYYVAEFDVAACNIPINDYSIVMNVIQFRILVLPWIQLSVVFTDTIYSGGYTV